MKRTLQGTYVAAAQRVLAPGVLRRPRPSPRRARRCREMLRNSPTALRVLKSALNAAEDGQAGIQQLGGDATLLFYQCEEGNEVGRGRAGPGAGKKGVAGTRGGGGSPSPWQPAVQAGEEPGW